MAASANYNLYSFYYNQELASSYYLHHQTHAVGYYQAGCLVYSHMWVPLCHQFQPHPSGFRTFYNHNSISHPARFSSRAESDGYHQFTSCDGSWVLISEEEEFGLRSFHPNSFSGWTTDGNYHQFMPCDGSWVLNPQEEQLQPQPGIRHYVQNVTNDQTSFTGRPENSNYQFMACDDSLILDLQEEEEEREIVPNEEEIADWLENHVVVYDSADVDDEGLCEETISKNLKLKDRYPEADSQICVVCQDCLFQEDEKIAGLDCGHDFHTGCITSWLTFKNSCPLCKAKGICL